jgi:hypothetical protein
MNGIFANYLWTMFWGKRRILNILNRVIFPAKYKYRCVRVYVWFNPLDAKPFSLISAKGFLVKFAYREVMTLSV